MNTEMNTTEQNNALLEKQYAKIMQNSPNSCSHEQSYEFNTAFEIFTLHDTSSYDTKTTSKL